MANARVHRTLRLRVRAPRFGQACSCLFLSKVGETLTSPSDARRSEWHRTPKHGSWLNMTECELTTLSGQCLDRHFAGRLTTELVEAWVIHRNTPQLQGRLPIYSRRRALYRGLGHSTLSAQYPRSPRFV